MPEKVIWDWSSGRVSQWRTTIGNLSVTVSHERGSVIWSWSVRRPWQTDMRRSHATSLKVAKAQAVTYAQEHATGVRP